MLRRRPEQFVSPYKRLARVELTDAQKQEVQEAFELFDVDKTGRLDYHELKVALRALGFEVKKADVLKLMEEHDIHQSGTVGFDEFYEIVWQRTAARSPEDELRKAFELFDEDATGRISLRNMRHIARELGENLTDEEMQAMIDEFDVDQDGEISYQEFASIMHSSALYED
uniref:EF-hand domain-containing protein n=1 Tax=Coccolithus braarudii TaxID=221442 RepID=A0A7S0LEI9_9EUKA|mmetsp:Transcript_3561/g.7487  ORF Transcript_3561/g.7487 Transcript_3561/m.7487 type:complete len:171 (+) Transcript_3561:68-580(+)